MSLKRLAAVLLVVLGCPIAFAQVDAPPTTTPKATRKNVRSASTPMPTETPAAEEVLDEEAGRSSPRFAWQAPLSTEESRTFRCAAHLAYRGDGHPDGTAASLFDLTALKRFGDDAVTGEGWVRFSKDASNGDRAGDLELRTARATYSEPWIQASAGRFDLFPHLTPNAFFGAYPVMGMRRVDGVLVILPAFFKFGVRDDKTYTMPPASVSLFYSPTFFGERHTILDQSQSFSLAQARFRAAIGDVQLGWRGNYSRSRETWFAYSAFSGVPAYSVAMDACWRRDYSASVEYGVQNVSRWRATNAVSGGLRAVRVATFGPWSLDDVVLEAQWPIARIASNAFTGGNDLVPLLAERAQASWYARVRSRLKALIVEFHATTNQDDFTLGRLVQEATYYRFEGRFGPGLEAEGPGLPFRSRSYRDPLFMARVGVEF